LALSISLFAYETARFGGVNIGLQRKLSTSKIGIFSTARQDYAIREQIYRFALIVPILMQDYKMHQWIIMRQYRYI
jgi:hypothetical protein